MDCDDLYRETLLRTPDVLIIYEDSPPGVHLLLPYCNRISEKGPLLCLLWRYGLRKTSA
jgi:hypothetical protein